MKPLHRGILAAAIGGAGLAASRLIKDKLADKGSHPRKSHTSKDDK